MTVNVNAFRTELNRFFCSVTRTLGYRPRYELAYAATEYGVDYHIVFTDDREIPDELLLSSFNDFIDRCKKSEVSA